MWKWVSFYLLAFALGIIIAIFDWPFWIAIIVLTIFSIVIAGEFLYTYFGTTNMKKVEKLILSKMKKEPIYRYIYAQGFESTEEQILAIDTILKKYKQPHIQHYYRAIQFYLKDNLQLALEEANKIEKEPLKSYMLAYVHATMGNEQEALSYKFTKPWMQEGILATVALNKNDRDAFSHHADKSISYARGIQRLSLTYSFSQMRK